MNAESDFERKEGRVIILTQEQINLLERLASSPERQRERVPLVERKEGGGYRVTDFPLSVESLNVSLHINADGSVDTVHNEEEVRRIFSQLERSK